MTRTCIAILASTLLLSVYASAQKKPVRKPNIDGRKELIVSHPDGLPEIKDFAFVISVDKSGNSTIKIQGSESSDRLTVGQTGDLFKKFVSLQNSKTPAASDKYLDPIVIVKPDADVEIKTLITVISAARVSYNSRIKIAAGDGIDLLVPRKPGDNPLANIRPNPLTLIIQMTEAGGLTLNNEAQGSLSNLIPLTKLLTTIFKERETNGVLREGSNEVEKTVFIKMPANSKFMDLTTLARALAGAGSGPIGLQVDDVDVSRVEMVTTIK